MAGLKALADYDAGLTSGYLARAEALFELAMSVLKSTDGTTDRAIPSHMIVELRCTSTVDERERRSTGVTKTPLDFTNPLAA
jgi:hypothetical protein